MEDKEILIKIISKDPSLCDHWSSCKCYYPEGWRNKKVSKGEEDKLPNCVCKPGNTETMCNKCKPDSVLLDSRPSLFKEEGK